MHPRSILQELNAAPAALKASSASLVLANLVPLAGALFLGWDVLALMALFWAENAILGFFNVLRMLAARPGDRRAFSEKLFLVPFFAVHYGLFTLVHGLFIFALFGAGELQPARGLSLDLSVFQGGTGWSLAGLAASHGLSFALNYLGRGRYREAQLKKLMLEPYGRIVLLHAAILGGGLLVKSLGAPVLGLALLVLLKIGLDLAAHLRGHRGPREAAAPGPAQS